MSSLFSRRGFAIYFLCISVFLPFIHFSLTLYSFICSIDNLLQFKLVVFKHWTTWIVFRLLKDFSICHINWSKMCLHMLLICVVFMAVGKMKLKALRGVKSAPTRTLLLSGQYCASVHKLGTKLKVSWNI